MSVVWDIEPDKMLVEVAEDYAKAIHEAVYTICLRYAPEIEAWMKANAPWTDRTGNARQTLQARAEKTIEQIIEIVMGHGMTYGWNLELDHGGRFAIVNPALDYFAPKVWADVRSLMS